MGLRYGFEAKLYRLSTGTRAAWPGTGAPSNLDLVPNVRDLTLERAASELDVTTRGGGGYKATAPGLIDASLSFEMNWDTADTDFTAFQTAFNARATIAVAVLDTLSSTVGAQGLWADFVVTNFQRLEPLDDVLRVSVTLKPAYSTVPPEWVTVA